MYTTVVRAVDPAAYTPASHAVARRRLDVAPQRSAPAVVRAWSDDLLTVDLAPASPDAGPSRRHGRRR